MTAFILYFIAPLWLGASVGGAIGEIIRQCRAFGRVPCWDWVAYQLLLGPITELNHSLDRGLTYVRTHWQSVGPSIPADVDRHPREPWFDIDVVIGWTIIAVLVLVSFLIGLAPVLAFGLAWGIIALIVTIGAAWWLTPGGPGWGYLFAGGLVCLIAGFVVGLLIRILT